MFQGGCDVRGLGIHVGYPPHLGRGSGEAAHHKSFGGGPHSHGLLRLVGAPLVSATSTVFLQPPSVYINSLIYSRPVYC